MRFKLKTIVKKKVSEKYNKVYDLTVNHNHSYCVHNIIVHNCGFPQLAAIDECSFAVHGKPHGHVCSDGGIRSAGDVSKAFAAGADFCMIGTILAGTEECDGEWEFAPKWITENGIPRMVGNAKSSLKFYGMSSKEAQEKYGEGLNDYRTSEGRCVKVPYKGRVDDVVQDILGGVRSACTYVGAKNLKDLPKCACFARVNDTHNRILEK